MRTAEQITKDLKKKKFKSWQDLDLYLMSDSISYQDVQILCLYWGDSFEYQLGERIWNNWKREKTKKDPIVKSVRKDLKQRSEKGIEKYGTTLDRNDLELADWLQHAYEETLDKALYLKRAIKELQTQKK